jgi:hypothetical protein
MLHSGAPFLLGKKSVFGKVRHPGGDGADDSSTGPSTMLINQHF